MHANALSRHVSLYKERTSRVELDVCDVYERKIGAMMLTRDPAGMNRYGGKCVRMSWGMAKQDRKDANAAIPPKHRQWVPHGGIRPLPGDKNLSKPVAGKAPEWPLQH